jgi:hypothetical protein
MKPETNTKPKAKVASGKKSTLKGMTKNSAVITTRLANNYNETLLIR